MLSVASVSAYLWIALCLITFYQQDHTWSHLLYSLFCTETQLHQCNNLTIVYTRPCCWKNEINKTIWFRVGSQHVFLTHSKYFKAYKYIVCSTIIEEYKSIDASFRRCEITAESPEKTYMVNLVWGSRLHWWAASVLTNLLSKLPCGPCTTKLFVI